MLTQKDFKAIAKILKQNSDTNSATMVENDILIAQITRYFETQNPRFNRDKFLVACGI